MAQLWEVVGGVGVGGILVRAERDLRSPELPGRLATGAVVREEALLGNRLLYARVAGTGPERGWVSISLRDKALLVRRAPQPAPEAPRPPPARPGTTSGSRDEAGITGWADGAGYGRREPLGGAGYERPELPGGAGYERRELPGRPAGRGAAVEPPPSRRPGSGAWSQAALRQPSFALHPALPPLAGRPGQLPLVLSPLERVKAALSSLGRPVSAILSIRSDMERRAGNFRVQQSQLREQEVRLARALEEVRIAADALDPSSSPPARARLRCATPACRFRVHPRESLGGYCCHACFSPGGSHGPRCLQSEALAGAERADPTEPVTLEQLEQIELDESVRLVKAQTARKSAAGPEDTTWLATDPKWSRSGAGAIGKWVSSIIDDEFGNPDNSGPKQLLEGGIWVSRRGGRTNQWIVFDLGKDSLVAEVRTRGHYVNTTFNPRRMQWQKGPGLDGPWTTCMSFSGSQDSDWVVARVDPPQTSRWWRLFVVSNYGAYDYVWLHGFALRVSQEACAEDANVVDGERRAQAATEPDSCAPAEHTAAVEDADKKEDADAHRAWTQADLRRNDESWEQLRGYQKLLFHALFCDRVLFLEDKPYIDYNWHSVEQYAADFLEQPGEMGWSLDFSPNFFCELAYEGFNPASIEIPSDNDLMVQVLTPCFEPKRNVLVCLSTHVGRKARRRARRCSVSLDTAYDDVMLGCIRQHGEGWLYRGERWALRRLREVGYTGPRDIKFAAHSFELWDEHGELVAGDLGYTLGGVYVSQTGFRKAGTSGAGEVQLVLMSALLHRLGHEWFDLGQARTYKAALGALTLDRRDWLQRFRGARDGSCSLACPGRLDGGELIGELLGAIARRRPAEPPPAAAAEDALQCSEARGESEEEECRVQ